MPARPVGGSERIQADTRFDMLAQAVQEFALVAANVEHFDSRWDPRPGHAGTPVLQDSIESGASHFPIGLTFEEDCAPNQAASSQSTSAPRE